MKSPTGTVPVPAEQASSDAGDACGPASDKRRTAAAERWLEENREALESSNDYVDRMGLPLARYRRY